MPDDDTAPPNRYGNNNNDRGGGGKIRRDRKPASTPYDRPPRWISKFVDPAKRILSGGATRFLPSFFSPSPSSSPDEVQEEEVEEEIRDRTEDFRVDAVALDQAENVGCSNAEGKAKLNLGSKDGLDKRGDHPDGSMPDVEQLIKGKTFSREEIDHLMEILRSRVVNVEEERKSVNMSRLEEVGRPQTILEKQKRPIIEGEETDRFQMASSTPLRQPIIQDEIGASPIDIARAYMGSRTSEVGFPSSSLRSKNEKLGLPSDFSSKPSLRSPLSKAPICWPGAITQNQQSYATPLSQKSRYGIHTFPRTPYSRTIFTKTNSKLTPSRGDSEMVPNIMSTPFHPVATPVQGKSMSNVGEGSYGSGGPMRRTRNKFASATSARGSILSRSKQRSPFFNEANAEFTPKKIWEPSSSSILKSENRKAPNFEVGVSSVHPHSTQVARQILEQIDRPITLKQRSNELKIAGSWKTSSAPAMASPVPNVSSNNMVGLGVSKSMDLEGTKLNAQKNAGYNASPHEKTDNVNSYAGKDVAFSSLINLEKTNSISGGSDEQSPNNQKFVSQTRGPAQAINNNFQRNPLTVGEQSNGLGITHKSVRSEQQSPQRKPLLSSISINKPGLRTSFTSDNSAGFSFPITTSSSTLLDLPTPTVMPSFLPNSPPKSTVSANSPPKITIAEPVVPLPFSSASTSNDVEAPKFKFGSGKSRLSFALEGDNTGSSTIDAPSVKYKFGSGKSRLSFGLRGSDAVHC